MRGTVFPEESNSFVGKMSCDGCNPNSGDTACTVSLPLLCIIGPKNFDRPFYSFYPEFTPYANADAGAYEGWTGGVFGLTDPFRGIDINSFRNGDNLCKTYFGPTAKFADFMDGWFMPYMNAPAVSIEKNWSFGKAAPSSYGLWGYFNHADTGRVWVSNLASPSSNCFNLNG